MKMVSFFDMQEKMETIDKHGDPLKELDKRIKWSVLQEVLREWERKRPTKERGGRPNYDALMMLKVLILQKYYNMSDKQAEVMIRDRLTFIRFLGLGLGDKTPDEKTIWQYRDMWTKEGILEKLFEAFNKYLEEEGVVAREGSIVDASFIDRPCQKMSTEEYKQIEQGEVPERIKENESRLRQTDMDARMAKKGAKSCNGYKTHIKVDAQSKCVVKIETTPANVSDIEMIVPLMDGKDKVIYADKGYVGKLKRKQIKHKVKREGKRKIKIQILERATKGHPLSEAAQERNRKRSKVRALVEHVFATIKHDWGYRIVRSVGLVRARGHMVLAALAYNIKRVSLLFGRSSEKDGSTVPA